MPDVECSTVITGAPGPWFWITTKATTRAVTATPATTHGIAPLRATLCKNVVGPSGCPEAVGAGDGLELDGDGDPDGPPDE
jgi:hypothetical protein